MADEIDRAWVQQGRIPDKDWELREVALHLITQVENVAGDQWRADPKKLRTWSRKYRQLRKRRGRGWHSAQKKAYPDVFKVLAKALSLERDLYLESFDALPQDKIKRAIRDGSLRSVNDAHLGKLYLYRIDRLEAGELRWALTTIWARIHASKHGAKLLKSLRESRAHSSDPVVIAEYKEDDKALGLNANYENLTIAGIGDGSMKYSKWTRETLVLVLSNELFEAVWGLQRSGASLEFQTLTLSLSRRLAKEAMGKAYSLAASDVVEDIESYRKDFSSYQVSDYESLRAPLDAVTEYVTSGRRTSFLHLWPLGHLGHRAIRGAITVGTRSHEVFFFFDASKVVVSDAKNKLTISRVQGQYYWLNGKQYVYGDFLNGTLVIDFDEPAAQTLTVPKTVTGELAGRRFVRRPRLRLEFDWKPVPHGKESGKGYFLIDFEEEDAYVGEWGRGQARSGGGFWTGRLEAN